MIRALARQFQTLQTIIRRILKEDLPGPDKLGQGEGPGTNCAEAEEASVVPVHVEQAQVRGNRQDPCGQQ